MESDSSSQKGLTPPSAPGKSSQIPRFSVDSRVIDYIQKAFEKGYDEYQIRSNLAKAGWSHEDIVESMKAWKERPKNYRFSLSHMLEVVFPLLFFMGAVILAGIIFLFIITLGGLR